MAGSADTMTKSIKIQTSSQVLANLIKTINDNRQYLSEIDGAIGDGDHGINMSKGFTQCGEALNAMSSPPDLAKAFDTLALSLLEGIGGSMGPLYGNFFMAFADTLSGKSDLDAPLFGQALDTAIASVQELGNAKVGDKTLMDTLIPAQAAFNAALKDNRSFAACLDAMAEGAEKGKESTIPLQARIGRASRLGERSIGVLDAGATSCCLILQSMAHSIKALLSA